MRAEYDISRNTVYKPKAKVAPSKKAIVEEASGVFGMLPRGALAAGSVSRAFFVARRCLSRASRLSSLWVDIVMNGQDKIMMMVTISSHYLFLLSRTCPSQPMTFARCWQRSIQKFHPRPVSRYYSSSAVQDGSNFRNIALVAHIGSLDSVVRSIS